MLLKRVKKIFELSIACYTAPQIDDDDNNNDNTNNKYTTT